MNFPFLSSQEESCEALLDRISCDARIERNEEDSGTKPRSSTEKSVAFTDGLGKATVRTSFSAM